MTQYRKAEKSAVEHRGTKYDNFTMSKTEHPYTHQKGSGRSICFELAKDGMKIGAWTKACAAKGYDSKFVVGSILKLQDAKSPGWVISAKDSDGRSLADIKSIRDADPVKAAARAEKLEAKAKAKAEREAAREARKTALAASKAKAKEEREAKAEAKAKEKADAAEKKAKAAAAKKIESEKKAKDAAAKKA